MARDNDRNSYITIGIPYESAFYQALEQDAEACGRSIADVAKMRLYDFYRKSSYADAPLLPPGASYDPERKPKKPERKKKSQALNGNVVKFDRSKQQDGQKTGEDTSTFNQTNMDDFAAESFESMFS